MQGYYHARAREYDDFWLRRGLYADYVRFVAETRRVAPELVVVASPPGQGDELERWEERVLDDGSRWQVFKRVFDTRDLLGELGGGRVLHEGRWFVAVSA